ncbi:MAG: TetR/AcrR family transcriptional regulator [Propionicimonas sp.]
MDAVGSVGTVRRPALNRVRVLDAAIAFADARGIESLSMRTLALELGVVPMALYKHVASKEDLLDGMLEVVVGRIRPGLVTGSWKQDVRARILGAREALLRYTWSRAVLESRNALTPPLLDHLDSLTGLFLAGGLSVDLTHHAMHALGNRMWGFSQDLFASGPAPDPEVHAVQAEMLRSLYPHLADMALAASHDAGSVVGPGCDDQFEFEFALDLLLDGVERLHSRHWASPRRSLASGRL